MSSNVRQIFLSAVSREFRRCREELKGNLSGPDLPCAICEQEEFSVSGMVLLNKLDRYVMESSSVIHLLGRAAGYVPDPGEVADFLRLKPDFLKQKPDLRAALGDCSGISYTQWEAFLALHHEVPLFIFDAKETFERPAGFYVKREEALSQQLHRQRLEGTGVDRGVFRTVEDLSIQVLRSLSRMLHRSSDAADQDSALDLEAFAQAREEAKPTEPAERSALAPLILDLALPAHLLVGQSLAAEFSIQEPGHTSLENILLTLDVGGARATARRSHLERGQSAHLIADEALVLAQEGTPTMQLTVSCERSCMRERFGWQEVANVITAEMLLSRTGTLSRSRPRPRRIRLELMDEELRPRRGVLELDLQPVPAGGRRFEMGSQPTERGRQPDEDLHPVRFTRSWWMSRHPISQAQFQAVMGRNPAKFAAQSDRFPVESVSWFESVDFCEKLTQIEMMEDKLPLGFHYRLPTEAEWEFSCRAGDESVPQTSSSRGSTEAPIAHAISTFPLDGNRGANRFGLCDMTGNVFQWCLDHYSPYPATLEVDPCHEKEANNRVIRGGSWHDPAPLRRPAARMQCAPETRSSRIGFRVVLARV